LYFGRRRVGIVWILHLVAGSNPLHDISQ